MFKRAKMLKRALSRFNGGQGQSNEVIIWAVDIRIRQ